MTEALPGVLNREYNYTGSDALVGIVGYLGGVSVEYSTLSCTPLT